MMPEIQKSHVDLFLLGMAVAWTGARPIGSSSRLASFLAAGLTYGFSLVEPPCEAFRGFPEKVDRDRARRRKHAHTRVAELAYVPEA